MQERLKEAEEKLPRLVEEHTQLTSIIRQMQTEFPKLTERAELLMAEILRTDGRIGALREEVEAAAGKDGAAQ